MDEIEQYQARIFAALDKVSGLVSDAAGRQSQNDHDMQRDVVLIGELEATLAEEQADLKAERALTTTTQQQLQAIENALAVAKADRLSAQNRLKDEQTVRDEAEKARDEAEQALVTTNSALVDLQRTTQQQQKELERAQGTGRRLEERAAHLMARIENQDVQFQRLKDANAQLRDSNAVLRERNAAMLADPAAINQSMQAELDALKTTRAADVDEMDAILEELKPLVEGNANA